MLPPRSVDRKLTDLSMLMTTRIAEERMKPPVLNIMRILQTGLPAYHSIVSLQRVSVGRTT